MITGYGALKIFMKRIVVEKMKDGLQSLTSFE